MDQRRIKRKLTAGEIEMLKRVFGGEVNYDLIRIHNYDGDTTDDTERSYHGANMIYLFDGDYADDISTSGDMEKKYVLVHEVAHAWQYQCGRLSHQENLDAHYRSASEKAESNLKSIKRDIEYEVTRNRKEDQDYVRKRLELKHRDTMHKLWIAGYVNKLKIKEDKNGYLIRQGYDPILSTMGPRHEFNPPQTHFDYPGGSKAHDLAPVEREFIENDRPRDGERLSDFMWRNPEIRRYYKDKEDLADNMRKWAEEDDGSGSDRPDYNYLLHHAGTVNFYDLRIEAQAELIAEYFLVKNGVDPRTIGSTNFLTRPPVAFYEKIIPFVIDPPPINLFPANFKD